LAWQSWLPTQLPPIPRNANSHVWICALIMPGMTMRGAIDDRRIFHTDTAAGFGDFPAVDQNVAAVNIADTRVHRDDGRVSDESYWHGLPCLHDNYRAVK
jgi:hypothetical protein